MSGYRRPRPDDSAHGDGDILPQNPPTEAAIEQTSDTRTQGAHRISQNEESASNESSLLNQIGSIHSYEEASSHRASQRTSYVARLDDGRISAWLHDRGQDIQGRLLFEPFESSNIRKSSPNNDTPKHVPPHMNAFSTAEAVKDGAPNIKIEYPSESLQTAPSDSSFTPSRVLTTRSPEANMAIKDAIANRLMLRLRIWLDERFQGQANQKTFTSSDQQSRSNPTKTKPSRESSSKSGSGKRQRKDLGDGRSGAGNGDDSNEKDEDDGLGHQKRLRADKNPPSLKFACPFFKHDRIRYGGTDWNWCWISGWPTVHRVKEHLYRRHKVSDSPEYECNRCFEAFNSASVLKDHQRAPDPCQLRDQVHREGIDQEKEQALRRRKHHNGKSTEEKDWVEVYKILFPEARKIPSPYYECVSGMMVERFAMFAQDELPSRLYPRLDPLVGDDREGNPTLDEFRDLTRNALEEIVDAFRQTIESNGVQPETIQPQPPRLDEVVDLVEEEGSVSQQRILDTQAFLPQVSVAVDCPEMGELQDATFLSQFSESWTDAPRPDDCNELARLHSDLVEEAPANMVTEEDVSYFIALLESGKFQDSGYESGNLEENAQP
ncbi:hypothetical protein B0T10DRAFT_550388 [Thelonectria olida]|uniref:C2H2-type domain-containing protein n=1 Tax=Thelonectria olida TaxID=1576542 RepID=A0A9P8W0P8_9HYPO|nr:hypothetical protein B0T10DRAFT_550388 [Thelonectria olida]